MKLWYVTNWYGWNPGVVIRAETVESALRVYGEENDLAGVICVVELKTEGDERVLDFAWEDYIGHFKGYEFKTTGQLINVTEPSLL